MEWKNVVLVKVLDNKITIAMERVFDRGLDMFNPNLYTDKKVGIIWAGWIGSNSAYVLSKMWIKCKVCDFDNVDTVNTSSQFYGMTQLNKPKVEMLKENIKALCDEDIEIINDKFNAEHFADCDILVLALDSLAVRKQVIETAKDTQFILDTRMVKKISEINTLYWAQKQAWLDKEWDENADSESGWVRCTEKAVAFNALGMASLVWALVADHLKWKALMYKYILDLENYGLMTFNS